MVSLKRGDFYILTKLDMSTLGSMGSSPAVAWTEYFRGSANARKRAAEDNGKKIDWKINGAVLSSGDLTTHMYEITSIKCKD